MPTESLPATSPLLSAALDYAKRGWHVFPVHSPDPKTHACSCGKRECESPGKHPRTPHGLKDATIDEATIRQWWRAWPMANVAIVTGRISGLVVVDVDPRNGGERPAGLPDTVEAQTGGGGEHLFFRYPEVRKLRWPKAIAAGVDLKTDGGYVVAAPSLHASGGRYIWDLLRGPDDVALAELPDWVTAKDISKHNGHGAVADETAIPPGERNPTLFREAGKLRRAGVGTVAVEAALLAMNLRNCKPPLPEEEVRAIAKGIQRYEPGPEEPPHPAESARDGPSPFEGRSDVVSAAEISTEEASELHPLTQSFASLCQILRHMSAPVFGVAKLEFDLMAQVPTVGRKPLTDAMISMARERIERHFTHFKTDQHLKFGADAIRDALAFIAHEAEFHPVAEYLRGLRWDGVERLAKLTETTVGSATVNAATLFRRWFVGAARRALEPGCKLDTVLLLHGKQGIGKSTFFSTLAGSWFCDSPIDIKRKDSFLVLSSSWILEWAELESMIRARDADQVNAFLSSAVDRYLPPYGHTDIMVPRSSVIVATTNRAEFLDDTHGSRRFWAMSVESFDLDRLASERDQLWAEAASLVLAGESHYLTDEEDSAREISNKSYAQRDPWEGPVAEFAKDYETLSVEEILRGALKMRIGEWDRANQMRVAAILTRWNWTKARRRRGGSKEWIWEKPNDHA